MMEVLDKYGVRATVALNSDVCYAYPIIVQEGLKRGWEFMGHGVTNSIRLYGLSEKEERAVIQESINTLKEFIGESPKGWLGPGLAENVGTLQLLWEEGIRYVGDWINDDQPYPFTVGDGTLLSMPYPLEINDILVCLYNHGDSEDFYRMICKQFDVLYEEGGANARVMGISLHPYIIGVPHRIKSLDRALQYITKHPGVWLTTGRDIDDWYRQHYMKRSS
jgi:peptidoglycan/xylan/chitin deacetylase (PgdA/CDA1 family)